MMTTLALNPNRVFNDINEILSTSTAYPYIDYDLERGIIWQCHHLDDDFKMHLIFDVLAKALEKSFRKYPCLTFEDLKNRVKLIENIKNSAEALKCYYVSEKIFFSAFFCGIFGSNNEVLNGNIYTSHAQFNVKLDNIKTESKKLEVLTEERHSNLLKMTSIYDPENTSETTHYVALAFDQALQDKQWRKEHSSLLQHLYDSLNKIIAEEGIPIHNVMYIKNYIITPSQELVRTLTEQRVWTTFEMDSPKSKKSSFRMNSLYLTSLDENLSPYLDKNNYTPSTNTYRVSEESYFFIKSINEHLQNGDFSCFKDEQLLSLLPCPYFNTMPDFLTLCIAYINKSYKRVKIDIIDNALSLTVYSLTKETINLLNHPFIKEKITSLRLECSNQGIVSTNYQLSHLVNNLPSLKEITLPLPTHLNQMNLNKFQEYTNLKKLFLDFGECHSFEEHLKSFQRDLSVFNTSYFEIYIINTDHLPTSDILKIAKTFPTSKSISLKEVIDDELTYLSLKLTSLEILTLDGCSNIADKGIKSIEEHSLHLKELCLKGCVNVSEEAITSLVEKRGESLRKLELDKCNVSDALIKTLGDQCENLESLSLGCCKEITDIGVNTLAINNKKLKYLNLSSCQISDTSIKTITENLPDIEVLNLQDCDEISFRVIENLISKCSKLKSLNLQGTDLFDSEIEELKIRYPHVQLN